MTYEYAMLLLAVGFLLGVSIRPLRSAIRRHRRIVKARKASQQPARKRRRRKVRGTGIY